MFTTSHPSNAITGLSLTLAPSLLENTCLGLSSVTLFLRSHLLQQLTLSTVYLTQTAEKEGSLYHCMCLQGWRRGEGGDYWEEYALSWFSSLKMGIVTHDVCTLLDYLENHS